MKQLGTLDAAFVNLEQANTPQHIGGLGIYDPSSVPGGSLRFKQVIASFERRLNAHPMFRTRLVRVPGGVDRPYWVKDANFDVEFHLRHIALPQPGDWRQLCIQVARLQSRPLDMSRPLWEAYIIEGLSNMPNLPDGSFAIYTKMHHSLVDGAGGSSFMALLHDLEPDTDEASPEQQTQLADRTPGAVELLARAAVNRVKNNFSMIGSTIEYTAVAGKYLLAIAQNRIPAPEINAPKTSLNQSVGPHRVFDAAEFPLQGLKDIKNALGVTINDVALSLVGGALRRYLDITGEKVEGSLVATMPLDMRSRRDETDENNQVGSASCSLHTDVVEPIARLQAVSQSARLAKKDIEISPLADILRLPGAVSPALATSLAGLWSSSGISQHLPVNVSTVVTNVPGPNFSLYCNGARLVKYYGLGVLTPGVGIFHTVFSYLGNISIAVLADRDIMPDPDVYRDCLLSSYSELHEAALEHKASGDAGSKKTRSKTSGKTFPLRKSRARSVQTRNNSNPQKNSSAA